MLQILSGIDFTQFKDGLLKSSKSCKKKKLWMRWKRQWMGLKSSPLAAVRFVYLAEEFAVGDHNDPKNPFFWDEVIENSPGNVDYDPSAPKLFKWNSKLMDIASALVTYVDDLRISGASVETVWQATRQVASFFQYLGIQDTARKRRPPFKKNGSLGWRCI